jgi:hypothetical protein
MVRPRGRGGRLLHLPGISAVPTRARACGYSGSNPASALRSSHSSSASLCCAAIIYLFPMFVILLRAPFYLLLVSHCVARPSSICPLHMSLGLFVLRVVHLPVSVFVILLRVPFLSPTCESLHCASFIYLPPSYVTRIVCLARTSVLLYTAGAEGRKGDQTRWRAGRIKGWMW